MSNLAAFSYHTIGGYTPVYKRESRNKHAGNVINIGPITIERVVSPSGNEAYRVIGRERKLMSKAQLTKLRYHLDREIRGDERLQSQRKWREKNKDQCNEKLRRWRQENRDRLNARKRALYALKKSMR